jgi:hypothetical protein
VGEPPLLVGREAEAGRPTSENLPHGMGFSNSVLAPSKPP